MHTLQHVNMPVQEKAGGTVLSQVITHGSVKPVQDNSARSVHISLKKYPWNVAFPAIHHMPVVGSDEAY